MHFTKPGLASLTVLFAAISTPSAQAMPTYQRGEWEYHINTHIEAMGFSLPSLPVTVTSCVKSRNPVFETPEMKKAGCKFIDIKSHGEQLSYTARCKGNGSMVDTHYKMTFYHGDQEKGTFTQIRTTNRKIGSKANGTLVGKRIGECTKK